MNYNKTINFRTIILILSLGLIFMLPWEGVLNFPGMGSAGQNTVAKFIGFVVSAFWILSIIAGGQLRRPTSFHVVMCLFVMWNALSVFWSADVNKTIIHVVTWAQLFIFVYMLWDLYTTHSIMIAGLQAYIAGLYVALGSALFNYFSGSAFYTNYQRFSAGETNPDGFGFILALGIPVAWYLGVTMSNKKINGLLKFINYAYIPAAFIGIALSGTRTAMIAAIPGMAFGLSSLKRLQLWTRCMIFVFIFTVAFLSLPYIQTLTSFQRLSTTVNELTEGDLNQRSGLWREGIIAFSEHPFTGVGSNMFRSINSLGKVAHNSFISVLVELGLIGFLIFITMLTIAGVSAWYQPKWEARFWLTMMVVWSIGASTLTWEYRKSTWLFLGLLIASTALTPSRK